MDEITIRFPDELNEQGRLMLWFGAWLVGHDGDEAGWFYNARGGGAGRYPVPPEATGVRIRRWPSDGLDAEYADVLRPAWPAELDAATLDFDREQPFSLLRFPEGSPAG